MLFAKLKKELKVRKFKNNLVILKLCVRVNENIAQKLQYIKILKKNFKKYISNEFTVNIVYSIFL